MYCRHHSIKTIYLTFSVLCVNKWILVPGSPFYFCSVIAMGTREYIMNRCLYVRWKLFWERPVWNTKHSSISPILSSKGGQILSCSLVSWKASWFPTSFWMKNILLLLLILTKTDAMNFNFSTLFSYYPSIPVNIWLNVEVSGRKKHWLTDISHGSLLIQTRLSGKLKPFIDFGGSIGYTFFLVLK